PTDAHYTPIFFHYSADHRALHSFPTRRSSDLARAPRSFRATTPDERPSLICSPIPIRTASSRLQVQARVRQRLWAETLPHPGLKDRKSTRLNSSHVSISYAVFCLKKKKKIEKI